MGIQQQQAMVAHQNNNMEMMERRQRERQAAERAANPPGRPPRPDEDDSGDEVDQVSTRTLAMARYKRNDELMNEVFQTAAFGTKGVSPKPSAYSSFSQMEIEAKVNKLQTEIDHLKQKSDERRSRTEGGERSTVMSVDMIGDGIVI